MSRIREFYRSDTIQFAFKRLIISWTPIYRYFRHYSMYKYAFTKKPKLDILMEAPAEPSEPSVEVVQPSEEKIPDSSSGTIAVRRSYASLQNFTCFHSLSEVMMLI